MKLSSGAWSGFTESIGERLERRSGILRLAWQLILPAFLALSIATALFQGRNWLTPPELAGRPTLVVIFIALVVLPPLGLMLVRYPARRAIVALLGSFFVLWIAAWQPETRALGLVAAGPVLWAAVRRHGGWQVLALALTIMMISGAVYERTYGLLDTAGVRAIMQTHVTEATAFLFQEINRSLLALWTLLAITLLGLGALAKHRRAARNLVTFIALGVTTVLLPFGGKELVAKAKIIRTALRQVTDEQQALVPRDQIAAHRAQGPDVDIVLVLGESTSRRLWQLTGGPVPSTPQMAARGDKLINFTDVVSTHSHTVQALSAMMYRRLTVGADGSGGGGRVSLIDVLGRAGIATEWVSAQPAFGKWSGPISNLASSARQVSFTSVADQPANADGLATDRTLAALASNHNSSRLLVQHLAAAHWPYCSHQLRNDEFRAAPASAAWFGEADDRSVSLDCYIRSLRRVDAELARLDSAAQARTKPTVLIFVPDHGEDVEGGRGHISSAYTPSHVEIPMLISFNAAARQVLGDKEFALRDHQRSAFSNAWVFELILDLFNVQTDNLKLEAASLASKTYRALPRLIYPEDARIRYDSRSITDRKSPLDWTRLNLNEWRTARDSDVMLFAHRVNTIGKALDAKPMFDGIEMDIVYDASKDELFVHHPPAPNVGLTLTRQLEVTADRPALKIWLDMKNPSPANLSRVIAHLEALDRRFSIRSRAVVEIPATETTGQMTALADNGWKVSFYVPYDLADCNTAHDSASLANCEAKALAILDAARRMKASYLSFDYVLMPAVRRFIATKQEIPRLLTWRIDIDASRQDLTDQLESMRGFAGIIIAAPSTYQR
jgi:glucan phosphoethanolaminetransferase (alkaline phosphatase superfamily)